MTGLKIVTDNSLSPWAKRSEVERVSTA